MNTELTIKAPISGDINKLVEETSQRVVRCYRNFDKFFPGLLDYTEGIYSDDETTYEQAQANQYEYLLDQMQASPDSRLLEIGCGNGTLLRHAGMRDAKATGITISPEQVKLCHAAGLDARLLNYKYLDRGWHKQYV